ncbi:MAG: hypothetical protein U5L04_01795 [Trueperaceae bacterium]|nr:hypothetical protein [Trueperaceae bacterium]
MEDCIKITIFVDDDDEQGITWEHCGPVYVPEQGDVIEHTFGTGPLVVRYRKIAFEQDGPDVTRQLVELHCVPAEEST